MSRIKKRSLTHRGWFDKILMFPKATWPSGKARVCKTLITGSNPVVASTFLSLRDPRALTGVSQSP